MDPFLIAILLFAAALVLAFIDIFVPSGGILLILGVVAALGSVLFGFRSSITMGMAMLTAVAASVPAFAFFAIKIWPHTPIGKRVILRPPQEPKGSADEPQPLSEFVGKVFIAESALLPSGQLKIGYRRFNAIVHTGIVEAGQTVKIIGIRERILIVRLSDEPISEPNPVDIEATDPNDAGSLLDRPAEELGLDSIDD